MSAPRVEYATISLLSSLLASHRASGPLLRGYFNPNIPPVLPNQTLEPHPISTYDYDWLSRIQDQPEDGVQEVRVYVSCPVTLIPDFLFFWIRLGPSGLRVSSFSLGGCRFPLCMLLYWAVLLMVY